jgi:acyl-CoA thioesterase-1
MLFAGALLVAVAGTLLTWSDAQAQAVRIVALGASNTYGQGAGGPARAFPARLQALLKAKGHNVTITNAGISGNTTADMLRRLNSAVPQGTKIVIFGACEGLFNNQRKGVGTGAADIAAINARLQGRGIRVIEACGRGLPRGPDNIHLSGAGHAMLANQLLPQLLSALGKQ